MSYLLTIGWPIVAVALATGVGVGWFTRAPQGQGSANWMLWAALLLAALGFASFGQSFAGREALMVDFGLLASAAYFVGLPIGATTRPAEHAPPPVIVPAPVVEVAPAPIVEEAPAPVVEAALAPVVEVAPASAAEVAPAPVLEADPALAAAAAPPSPADKRFPGVKPETLAVPRDGAQQDLSKIKGLGPKSVEKLNSLGVFHTDQLAGWNLENAKWISAALGGPGRVERGKWIQQAREIVAKRKTGGGTG